MACETFFMEKFASITLSIHLDQRFTFMTFLKNKKFKQKKFLNFSIEIHVVESQETFTNRFFFGFKMVLKKEAVGKAQIFETVKFVCRSILLSKKLHQIYRKYALLSRLVLCVLYIYQSFLNFTREILK